MKRAPKTPPAQTPTHGNRTDRKKHEKEDARNHYGGRTQSPDRDVNEAEAISVEEGEEAAKAPHSKAVPRGGTGGEPPGDKPVKENPAKKPARKAE